MANSTEMHIDARDEPWEQLVDRNPYSVKTWFGYLQHKLGASPTSRYILYERALLNLPRSYKLWHAYIQERTLHLATKSIGDKRYEVLIDVFERCLEQMHKMPRIWLDFCSLLSYLKRGTQTRRAFDRAIQSLPITQHDRIWEAYIKWVRDFAVPETIVLAYDRYIMYDSSKREDYYQYLLSVDRFGDAAIQLAACVSDEDFNPPSGRTRHRLTMELCDLGAEHPDDMPAALCLPQIIRSGISKYSDEVGRLWCKLADYYTRLGDFSEAQRIYEEAMSKVLTVKDFSIVFDACVKVQEVKLTAMMEAVEDDDDEEPSADSQDIEEHMDRLEKLIDSRERLVNAVVLRQNAHNVHEWLKRIEMHTSHPEKVEVFKAAIAAVDPKSSQCVGKLSMLYTAYATYYEQRNSSADLQIANQIWDDATKVNFRTTEELATVYCGWAEMQIRMKKYQKALDITILAITEPFSSSKRRRTKTEAQGHGDDRDDDFDGSIPADRLYKNVKVWSLYLDLEESLGTIDTVRAAYDRAIELKVITIQMCLNYANYLEEAEYFEESFRVFERAVHLFAYPQVKTLWTTYLDKFMNRYEGSKLERLRDLFEKSLIDVTPAEAAEMHIKYARAEEKYGTIRHALSVYDRATRAVPVEMQLDMYRLYIKKIESTQGKLFSRQIYEEAVTRLNDDSCRDLCVEFAEMERQLNEIDRARAVFVHGSQFANPKRDTDYWLKWKNFEETHGNEETFRDMLRTKRTMDTKYAQINYAAIDALAASKDGGNREKRKQAEFAEASVEQESHSSPVEPYLKKLRN